GTGEEFSVGSTQVLSNPGVRLRVTPILFALLVDVDTKESVVELQ
nr:hypothetical protein [Tanacetum cinerariifolium]